MEKDNSAIDVPDWINTDFLLKILSRDCKEYKITSWKAERGSSPGDNYASVIYRVIVDLKYGDKIETESLVVKVELISEISQITEEGNAFGREIQAYSVVIPKMTKMLQEAFQNNFKPFAPDCYHTHLGPPGSVLVFEDLKKKSFRLAERSAGLDMKHSLLVVRSLAKYHASSAVLFEKQPELFEYFMTGVYRESNAETMRKLYDIVLRDLAKEVDKWPGYKRFSDKLIKMADDSIDITLDGVKRGEGDFNVLAHVDPWVTNIMFQYSKETEEVMDLRLIDFQGCQWLSPAVDIQRYLHSTPTVEVLDQHEYILEEYFKVLKDTLNALGYLHLCPTIEHLKKQMNRRAMIGISLGILTRAFYLGDPDEFPDINKVMRCETKLKFSKLYLDVIRKQLIVLEKYNWI